MARRPPGGGGGACPLPDPEENLKEALKREEPKVLFDRLMFPTPRGRMAYEWLAEGAGILGSDAPGLAFLRNGLWRLDYTPYLTPERRPLYVLVGERDGTSYPYAEEVARGSAPPSGSSRRRATTPGLTPPRPLKRPSRRPSPPWSPPSAGLW